MSQRVASISLCLLLMLSATAFSIAGCSRHPETPLVPSPLTASGPGGLALVAFPYRDEGVDFRGQLENKYIALGRTPSQVYVDHTGDAAWISEYQRYRVNGCDHTTAINYVRLQIDTGTAPPVCSASVFPETATYPSHDQYADFRRQLGKKYQSMGRSQQSAVDQDGIGIWMGDYYRYRSTGCDHGTASQKVLTQIDGNPAPESCLAQCAYRGGSISVPAAGGTFRGEPERTSGSCNWLAQSEAPWINLNQPITGGNRSPLSFTVEPNPGSPRRGSIRISYPGGQTYQDVDQGSATHNLAFQFFDPARSTTAVTECQIRSTATICTLTPVATLPAVIVNYDWHVDYSYDGSKSLSQNGPLSSMSFAESCGVLPGNNVGIPVSVQLTVTDAAGNSATVYSGSGAQPALQLRAFQCP